MPRVNRGRSVLPPVMVRFSADEREDLDRKAQGNRSELIRKAVKAFNADRRGRKCTSCDGQGFWEDDDQQIDCDPCAGTGAQPGEQGQ